MTDDARVYDTCPTCYSPVIPESTHNGYALVYHFVHCGWGHDGGGPRYTEAEALALRDAFQAGVAAERARLAPVVEAAEKAHAHTLELREAWRRGAISEHDSLGGTRSNRNVEVEVALRAALAEWKGAEGSLPSGCPGRPLTQDEEGRIMRRELDYRNGRWEARNA